MEAYCTCLCPANGEVTKVMRTVLKCAANLIEVFPKWHILCQHVWCGAMSLWCQKKKRPNNALLGGRHVGVHGLDACTEHQLKQNIWNAIMY